MKRFAMVVLTTLALATASSSADAQWVYRPVVVAPRPVTRVYHRPMVVYHPTTTVYARRRPILGGHSVRTRPSFHRTVVW